MMTPNPKKPRMMVTTNWLVALTIVLWAEASERESQQRQPASQPVSQSWLWKIELRTLDCTGFFYAACTTLCGSKCFLLCEHNRDTV